MERNTILLDVEEYNRLRDFKVRMEEGYAYSTTDYWCGQGGVTHTYITNDEALKKVAERNATLLKSLGETSKEMSDLKTEFILEVENSIKQRSLWSFIRIKYFKK